MRGAEAWRQLGIEPTDDVRAIRKAYAKALKAIDTEADPAAFIALREAMETAVRIAPMVGTEGEADWEEEGDWFDLCEDVAAPVVPPQPAVRSEPVPAEPPPAAPTEPSVRSEPVPSEPPRIAPGEPTVRSEPVPSEPPPAEPGEPPRFALPMLGPAPIARLEELLFGGAEPHTAYEIADLTHAIVTDPAMDRIEVAQATEIFIAGLIARAMPRSDDMIDVAAAHFGWDREEIAQPPLIAWVLRRREDRAFEAHLIANDGRFGRILEALRLPPPSPGGIGFSRRSVDVEYLLATLHRAHPTVFHGFDPETVAFWEDRIEAEREQGGIRGRLRERMWRRACRRGLWPQPRRVDFSLGVAIVFLPYIFGWLLLRRGHSTIARVAGFTWMAVALVLVLFPEVTEPPRSASSPPLLVVDTSADYRNPAEDLQPVLSGVSDRLTLADVEPRARAALEARWRKARDSKEPKEAFRDGAWAVITDAYSGALRGGSYGLLQGYWRLRAEKLDWTSRMAPMRCEAVLRGDEAENSTVTLYHQAQASALIRRALVEGTGRNPPPPRKTEGRYELPHEIIAAGAKRAGFPFEKMRKILVSGTGTPAERCRAESAYILALLSRPEKEARPLLRSMSSGL